MHTTAWVGNAAQSCGELQSANMDGHDGTEPKIPKHQARGHPLNPKFSVDPYHLHFLK